MLLLEELARDVFCYDGPEIMPSPPRHRLKLFGGDMSYEDFHDTQPGINACISPPLISVPEVYERVLPGAEAGVETWSVRGLHAAVPVPKPPPPPPTTLSSLEGTQQNRGTSLYESFVPSKAKMPPPPHVEISPQTSAVPNTLSMFLKKRPNR
jgi:hypothetical protein